MRIVVQRCLNSRVEIENKIIGQIDKGATILLCLEEGDTFNTISKAVTKIQNLRIYEDPETGKMNLNISQYGGKFLVISQFTLSWRGERGNRPSFDRSMKPDQAKEFYLRFCDELSKSSTVEKGEFAADMQVFIQNDGPVTFSLDFASSD